MSKTQKTKAALFALWTVWLIVSFYFLTQPGEESSQVSGFITRLFLRLFPFLNEDPSTLEYTIRKVAHFGCYAGSGLIGLFALRLTVLKHPIRLHIAIHILLAILSEVLQLFSAGRYCSPADMCIDFLGACCGLGAAALILLLSDHNKGRFRNG